MQVLTIPIQLDSASSSSLIEFGFPIPKGTVKYLEQLSVHIDQTQVEASATVTAYWDDNSIKMCVITFFQADALSHNSQVEVQISENELKHHQEPQLPLTKITKNHVLFETNNIQFSYDLSTHAFALVNKQTNLKQTGKLELRDNNNALLETELTSHQIVQKTDLQSVSTEDEIIVIEGKYLNTHQQTACLFSVAFSFYNKGTQLKLNSTIHNPHAAEHADGLWDLGDAQSFCFNSFGCSFDYPAPQDCQLQINQLSHSISQATQIIQYSSGGENWQSPVHQDKNQSIPFTVRGFEISENGNLIQSGYRASPTVQVVNQQTITLKHFWQNFPSSLTVDKSSINFEFFPKLDTSIHELQGGEKKTHELWVQFDTDETNKLDWVHQPVAVTLPTEWLNKTHLAEFIPFSSSCTPWQKIIENGIQGDNNFFHKREALDEYGWRNFGDLYADHETAEHTGEDIFVSHYNNQYDPILGFLKQYLLSGDNRWFELADDLAKHVVDIDIYHTQEDKAEYNGGLFWHTDHYLQAYTSSHRSYSQHQPSDAYQDHAGGGGPGGQHCYTTGLAMHYMLTANEPSKQAVLTLTNWITHVYEGSGTCLELLLAFKNRNVAGFKNHFTGQYPLDRGTANYVIALLDSFELTQEQDYLQRAEHILKNSFHPNEDISNRNLQDVENTWFYTVLLQAACKYLAIKESMGQLDGNFYYCRDSLLNFARWMTVYENPYLEKPEILEYPNDTWTAQDLRKVHIFAAAYYFSPIKNPVFLDKATYFQDDVLNRLNSSATKTYTRIMVLVMQNYGFLDLYKNRSEIPSYKESDFSWPKADYEKKSLLSGALRQMLKRLSKLSIKSEMNWLKKRLN